MAEFTGGGKAFDRRGFLKGSALFAATAVGLAAVVAPAFAQEVAGQNKPTEEPKKPAAGEAAKEGEASKDAAKPDPKAQEASKQDPNKLYDKSGREYRVCERCGGNMYKEEKTWTCEQCGLSYTE